MAILGRTSSAPGSARCCDGATFVTSPPVSSLRTPAIVSTVLGMPWLARHVPLGPALAVTSWRKVAIGTWRTARDPSAYLSLEFNAEPALAYLAALGTRTSP